MQLIDLTHQFSKPMPVFPGDDEPDLHQTDTVDENGVAHFYLKTGMHVGTHIDAPFHFIKDGKLIADYPPQTFFGRGVLIDARGQQTIHERLLEGVDIQSHDIVLVLTGKSKNYLSPAYFENFPEVTEEFAQKLIDRGVSMLGLDTCSPDNKPYSIHKQLLGAGILIIENLVNLEDLLNKKFSVIALPLKIEAEAGLARVVAGVEN